MSKVLSRSKSWRVRSPKESGSDDISSPQLISTNAEPRNDLRDLSTAPTTPPKDERPRRSEAGTRPRTSSGPGDRTTTALPKSTPIVIPSEYDYVKFPMPANTAVMYAEVHDEANIGVALGSPTQAPIWTQAQYPASSIASTVAATESTSGDEVPHELLRPKVSRWRSLFGRKSPQPSSPFYQLQTPTSASSDSHDHAVAKATRPGAARAESSPITAVHAKKDLKKTRLAKPSLDQMRTKDSSGHQTPAEPRLRGFSTSKHGEESPIPPMKDYPPRTANIPKVTVNNYALSPPDPDGRSPLLDIDIPNTTMDRYSVMFGSVLKADKRSSLLARRQGNVEKLQPLSEAALKVRFVTHDIHSSILITSQSNPPDDDGILVKPRRATSPSYRSPTFSLFPPAKPQKAPRSPSPLHRPRPLRRSHTAPAASPNRPSFDKTGLLTPTSTEEPTSATTQTLATPSTMRSFDEGETTPGVAHDAKPLKPRVNEPSWEMVTKPTTAEPGVAAPVEASKPSQTSSAKTKSNREKSPDGGSQVAQVSVARQISVSRARNPLLVRPVVSNRDERFVERKPLTPTLVELKNRKSQTVQIVDA